MSLYNISPHPIPIGGSFLYENILLLICIDNSCVENELTIGKSYYFNTITGVFNDINETKLYEIERFVTKEKYRNLKIKEILE